MKTSARKEKRLMAEHERFGWFGLVRFRDVYEFECYLMQRGWKPCVTLGRSLMRVVRDGDASSRWSGILRSARP